MRRALVLNLSKIAIGTKIVISAIMKTNDTDNEEIKYVSKLLDITNDEIIKISMPIHRGKIIILSDSFEYELYFYTPTGIFRGQANIVDRYKSNNVLVLAMELTTQLSKYQRREYYRLECLIDMKFIYFDATLIDDINIWNLLNDYENQQKGIFVDISGGGGRFVTKEKLEVANNIIIIFSLPINNVVKEFTLMGHIIASDKVENKSGQYENRCKFIRVNKNERELIIKYIFEQERRKRIIK